MNFVAILGLLAAFLTTAAYVPQAYKTITTRSTSSLSLPTYSMLFLGTLLWVGYAVAIDNVPVLIANGVTALLAGIILYLKLMTKPE
ncbi:MULTISPECIES: SemiSWEET family sugar transporter [Hymenobacter]|uniref:MtN3 and saliva related transmembrane protein n=1 Tax=Hymenobacter mucosus TaxID=1411120 RepID=A0A238XI49_9BACT|nr:MULTISPECIES: SemiSWEET transporter [Hymenobacter]SNR58004.1 MtN3 and saliva related transmembrane protein [Hymenobacter mucosus]